MAQPQLLVVETQRGDFLFACPSAAAAFAVEERLWWREHVGIDPTIRPVPLKANYRFREEAPDSLLVVGPGQAACRRVQRHVARWWRERDKWNSSAD